MLQHMLEVLDVPVAPTNEPNGDVYVLFFVQRVLLRSMRVRVAFRVGSYLSIWILHGNAPK